MNAPLRERTRGRWQGLLPSLGVSPRLLTGKHMACPICREGRDRFRFDDKDGGGTWICSRCGAGDGISLVMRVNGWDFKQAAVEIERHVGAVEYRTPTPKRSDADKRQDMNAVWQKATRIQAGDPAARYLSGRTGLAEFPDCLRSAERLRYYDESGSSFHPAMVAMVFDTDSRPVNIHRTYLSKSGSKAAVAEPRRTMPGELPKGSAIRLARHSGTLGIAEGIETALSATALFGVPCWAVINTAIMSKWTVPDDVSELVIFGDNDMNFAGQAAAYELAHRACRSGLAISVRLPPVAGSDWNDIHQQKSLAA